MAVEGNMMRRAAGFAWVLALTILIYGCGSLLSPDDKGPSGKAETEAGATTAVLTGCFTCHSDASNPAKFVKVAGDSAESKAAGTGWLPGPHGNYESVNPAYADFTDSSCKGCHDPQGSGELIAGFYAETGIDGIGKVNRPVVGCEACHGAGEDHLGTGPIDDAEPGAAKCGQCHNDSLPSDHLPHHPEADRIYENWTESAHAAKSVECKTCHDPHNPDRLAETAVTGASAQYQTCTAAECHPASAGSSIYDTHFDAALTPQRGGQGSPVVNTGGIEGYVIDPSSDRACSDCHNAHEADNTFNEQWGNSSHGGHILSTINATTGLANVTTATGPAWVYYDWKLSNRQDCQRCHTSTGFKNFAKGPSSYDANGDLLPDTPNVFTGVSNQAEMLYCWACHTDNVGGLRNPGVLNSTIAVYNAPSGRLPITSDLGDSNICTACHLGRRSGQDIKDKWTSVTIIGNTFDKFDSHYLEAGGIIFRTIGYEYDGRDYSDPVYYIHNVLGSSNGPCVACHMPSKSHEFESVEKSGGAITDITAYDETCYSCHRVSKSTLVNELNSLDGGFVNALDSLKGELGAQGIYYRTSYPYFFNSPTATATANRYKLWPDKDTLGAAFNLFSLGHEPGAYVHNSEYTKRLIYDSIDYIDDAAINNSVEATLLGAGATDAYNFLRGTRP